MSPPRISPESVNITLYGKRHDYVQHLNQNAITHSPIKRKWREISQIEEEKKHREKEKRTYDHGGQDRSNAAQPKEGHGDQKPGEAKHRFFPTALGGIWPSRHLDFMGEIQSLDF